MDISNLLIGQQHVSCPGGDRGAVPIVQRDKRASEREGAAHQGGPKDDGPHGRSAYRVVGFPLFSPFFLHVHAHGLAIRNAFSAQVQ